MTGIPGCGNPGVWKTRGVENTGSGEKHAVWKTRGLVENTGSQWKTWGPSGKRGGTMNRGKVRSRDPDIRGMEYWAAGCGKHGASGETRGLVENTESK